MGARCLLRPRRCTHRREGDRSKLRTASDHVRLTKAKREGAATNRRHLRGRRRHGEQGAAPTGRIRAIDRTPLLRPNTTWAHGRVHDRADHARLQRRRRLHGGPGRGWPHGFLGDGQGGPPRPHGPRVQPRRRAASQLRRRRRRRPELHLWSRWRDAPVPHRLRRAVPGRTRARPAGQLPVPAGGRRRRPAPPLLQRPAGGQDHRGGPGGRSRRLAPCRDARARRGRDRAGRRGRGRGGRCGEPGRRGRAHPHQLPAAGTPRRPRRRRRAGGVGAARRRPRSGRPASRAGVAADRHRSREHRSQGPGRGLAAAEQGLPPLDRQVAGPVPVGPRGGQGGGAHRRRPRGRQAARPRRRHRPPR